MRCHASGSDDPSDILSTIAPVRLPSFEGLLATRGEEQDDRILHPILHSNVASNGILRHELADLRLGESEGENEKTPESIENPGVLQRGRRGSNPQPPDRQSGALTN